MGYRTTRRQLKAQATRRKPADPITIGQKVLREWCAGSNVVVDALSGAYLIACITSAIIKDRQSSNGQRDV